MSAWAVHEAYEAWGVCFDQLTAARAAVAMWAVRAMHHVRRGEDRHPAVGWTFDAQDELEHAEAALSTAREEWDRAKAAEDERLKGAA